MIPGVYGADFAYFVKNELKKDIPIIIISAKDNFDEKISLLKDVVDDYINKPFKVDEIIARIFAVLRRYQNKVETQINKLEFKNIKIILDERKVLVKENEIYLTSLEFDILVILMKNIGKVFSRQMLYELVWDDGYFGENNTVNVHVSNIRKKISKFDDYNYIKTIYSIGFKLD